MARYMQCVLAANRHIGAVVKNIPSPSTRRPMPIMIRATYALGQSGNNCLLSTLSRTDRILTDGSTRVISAHFCTQRFLFHFTRATSFSNTPWIKRLPQQTHTAPTLIPMQNSDLFSYVLYQGGTALASGYSKQFVTSSTHANRSNRSSYESPGLGASQSQYCKRKRSNSVTGHISNAADTFDFLNNKRTRLKLKETKSKISKGVRSIRSNFFIQNRKLREKLQLQKAKKNGLVRSLKRQLATKTKKEDIKTIPNLLTTLRMASAPLLSYLVISDYYGCAFSIFVLAGLSDMLDGYIARNFKNQRTAFGTALDPLADKLLISFLTVSLTANGMIPVPLTVLILGRDAGLVIASFYIRYISLAPPRTLARYFDFSHVTAKIYPSNISKINTAFQLSYVACSLAAPVFDFVDSPWLQLLMYTTAATTFLSGADYMLTWRRRLRIVKNT